VGGARRAWGPSGARCRGVVGVQSSLPRARIPYRARRLVVVALAGLLMVAGTTALLPAAPARAVLAGLPAGFVDETVIGGLPYPTAIAFAPDATMFVALKSGIVRVAEGGTLLPTPFLDIRPQVHDNHDRGLLGLAVHPQFPVRPYVYLLYTHDPAGVTQDTGSPIVGRVSQLLRVEADPATGYRTAKAGTQTVLLGAGSTRANIGSETNGRDTTRASCMTGGTMAGVPVEDCIASDENSHTIGTLAFAPDGSLFVSSGDGSNYGGVDPRALRSQLPDSLNGKVLRIDALTGAGLPDNPFYDPDRPDRNRSKLWASGLRNPFRMTVHPVTGEAYIGDVGWNNWEEINVGKGANFGWPCYEGGVPGAPEGSATTSVQQGSYRTNTGTSAACAALYNQGVAAVRAPAYAYNHAAGGASANAGAVYIGTTYPAEYRGALFVADYNRRWIRYLTFDAQGRATAYPFAQESTSNGPVQLVTGPDTNLYWMRYGSSGGEVRRIRYVGAGNTPPVVQVAATPTIGQAPMPVTFTSTGSYDPDAQPFTYTWDFGDGATSSSPNPAHTFTTPGVYDVRLTLTETTAPFATAAETVRVTVGSNPPLATILTPPDGTTYAVGDTLTFTGSGTSGGAALPASALSWEIRHRHNEHVHYSTPDSSGSGAVSTMTLVPDDHGDSTAYQVCMTADAGGGLTDTRCIELVPRKTDHTLATSPPGLVLQYEDEGLSLPGPALIRPIVGSTQTVSVDPVQQSRTFTGWSDGVTSPTRSWVVGTTPRTFTAVYENRLPTARITGGSGGATPHTVTLSGTTSTDPEGDTLTYAWTDGRGGTSTSDTPTFTYDQPGTYPVGLTVTDQLGGTATATYPVVVTGLPVPWATTSIGAATVPGSASWAAGTFTVSNAGPGITQNADALRFVHQPRTGDLTLVARVDSLTDTNVYAKAGLMVRETLAANSREVMLAATPRTTDGIKLIQRAAPGATTTNQAYARGIVPPRWLKLVRSGNTFTGSQSADGVTWTVIGSTTVPMTASVQVGLAVGSQSTAVATARLSGVTLS
jgi:glucose/arabinose dehydrogenase